MKKLTKVQITQQRDQMIEDAWADLHNRLFEIRKDFERMNTDACRLFHYNIQYAHDWAYEQSKPIVIKTKWGVLFG